MKCLRDLTDLPTLDVIFAELVEQRDLAATARDVVAVMHREAALPG